MTPLSTASVPEAFASLPLREQKAARTRHTLITAAVSRMKVRPFAEVRVADLCREVPISEPTFFNHFPTKSHVLVHLILLGGIGVEWSVRKLEQRAGPKRAIDAIFEEYGDWMSREPHVAHEIFSHHAARRHAPRFPKISPGDRALWFPDRPGIDRIPEVGIIGVLTPRVEACRKAGLFSVSTEAATTAFLSVFMGVPMTWLWKNPKAVPRKYREQLRIAWKGLGVGVSKARTRK